MRPLIGDRVRLASGRRTATVSAIEGNRVHFDLGRGQHLRLDHNDRRLRLLEPEWGVSSPRTASAIAVLDSGDPAGQASFAQEVARAFDHCVFITDNRENFGLEEHHRLARAMPRGTGENLIVPDPADAVIEALRNFPQAGEDRDALMLATVMLGDGLPGDPLIEEARASLAERADEHVRRAGHSACIDAHCRYWSDIRASGAPRMLDCWRDYAGSLLDLGRALAEGKPEGAAFYQPGWGGFIDRLKAHSAANTIDRDLEPAVATWFNLNEASLERRAEIETFIREVRTLHIGPDSMEHMIRSARAMMRDRERYGVHLDHMADVPLARLITELQVRQQQSIHRSLGNSM